LAAAFSGGSFNNRLEASLKTYLFGRPTGGISNKTYRISGTGRATKRAKYEYAP